MYKVYEGNTGRSRTVREGNEKRAGGRQEMKKEGKNNPQSSYRSQMPRRAVPGADKIKDSRGLLGQLGSMLPKRLGELETEDFILILMLYLMYRESGDSELLIIMGAMFLL